MVATWDEVFDLATAVDAKFDRLLGTTGGGTLPPPDTSLARPTNFTATVLADRKVKLDWDNVDGTTWDVYEFLIDPNNTLKANVGVNTRTSGSLAGGNYQYGIRARNSSGEESPLSRLANVFISTTVETSTVEYTGGADADPSTGTTTNPDVSARLYPAEVMNLKPWKVTLPVLSGASIKEVKQPTLTTYSDKYFSLTDDKTGIRYRVWHGGETTEGSENPRTELREMNADGTAETAWSMNSGGPHDFELTLAVNRLTKVRPHVVLMQVHDADEDVAMFRLEGTSLYITDHNTAHAFLVTSSFKLNTKVKLKMEANAGKISFWYNGVKCNFTVSATTNTCYFKGGNYLQSNPTSAPGESTSEYSEVTHYAYVLSHAGVSSTVPPPPPGGTGNPGTTNPGFVPVGQTTVFSENFDNGLSGNNYSSVQTHAYDGSASGYPMNSDYRMQIGYFGGSGTAFRTEVRDGDTAVGSHRRCEVSSFGKFWNDNENNERWYEFDIRFETLPSMGSSDDWLIFFQWHNISLGDAPPLAMALHSDGKAYFEREPDSDYEFIPIWKPVAATWYHVIVHIKWSPNPSTGFIQCHVNGTEMVAKRTCRTQYTGDTSGQYVKFGQYRRGSSGGGVSTIFHDNIRVSGPPATVNTGSTTGSGGTGINQTRGVGGVAVPAGAIKTVSDSSSQLNITSGGTATSPKVYDGGGHTVGPIKVTANYVVVQNFKVDARSQYAFIVDNTTGVTLQNNQFRGVEASGDGDLNCGTLWGAKKLKIRYNDADNFTTVNPNGSHTDFIQTWVSSSHPVALDDVEIYENTCVLPANPGRSTSVPSLHQFFMCEGANLGGNSGGSGNPSNIKIYRNRIGDSWNQAIKIDGGTNIAIFDNDFVGSSDKVIEFATGSNLQFYRSNRVSSGYGSVGTTVNPGADPAVTA